MLLLLDTIDIDLYFLFCWDANLKYNQNTYLNYSLSMSNYTLNWNIYE